MPPEHWSPHGGGEMGELIRRRDWSQSPVGPSSTWPQSLRTALGIMLDSGYAMYIAWGPDFTQFYNDAYRPILGATKHPAALGRSTRETFPEIWDFIGPMFERVMSRGENTSLVNQLLPLNRYGYREECYFTFSYSAIRDEGSNVGGVLVTCIETTQTVLDERRLRILRELAGHATDTRGLDDARSRVEQTLRGNPYDLPVAHLLSRDALVERGFEHALASGGPVDDFDRAWAPVESPAWPGEIVKQAVLLPLPQAGNPLANAFLLAGISPRRALDANYESFLHLLAKQIAAVFDNARAYAAERRRAEALAELDRAKTAFFSNVSHEFRTPLTLLLEPLDEVLTNSPSLPNDLRQPLEMAQRNARRLLKLVNTLLEVSRMEAGRVQPRYEAVDLSQFTADLASAFRSTIAAAGLRFDVDCPPLAAPVYVDREMWETVVLNLLSNAYKFTFEGRIQVTLRGDGDRVLLQIADTGIGIPPAELPRIFDRFHRVEGSRGRTFEGSGIGLALVSELVRFHGGEIRVESREGAGSTFSISMPFGREHAPAETSDPSHPGAIASAAAVFVEEAERWSADPHSNGNDAAVPSEGRVLFADDNADVRQYVTRILSPRFTVMAVANGEEALQAIPRFQPDLLLSDVMMPRLDGYQLLSAIRSEERWRTLPVILLTARAGDEARIEGLEAGANDYLVKPFSARELLARVSSQVTIARLRHTERGLRDEARQAQQRFRDLLMQTPAAITLLRGPEHIFELANDEYVRMVGRTSEAELLGKRAVDLFPEVVGQGFIDLLDTVYRTGAPYIGRERFITIERADGAASQFYLNFVYQPVKDEQGRTEGILFHGADVTDLVTARNVTEHSEQQLRTLADSIPHLVWTCLADGRCDYLSKQWVAYTGVPAEDQLGLRWLDLVMHPDDRQRVYEAWMAAVEDRQPYDIEYRLKRFDGAYRWFKTRGTPVRDSAGQIEKWFGTCTDIEDQKLAEQHMLDQQKLESVGLLAGGIAHDFNNLLVGVLGNASLIDDSLPEKHPLLPMVRAIVDAGERAAHLTRQMLAYAGKGRMFVERFDVNALVRSAASLVDASFPKSVRMIVETASEPLTIEADTGQVQQVVMNLAINAAESVGPETKGSVWIRARLVTVDRQYLAAHRFTGEPPREGLYACIEVEDTGQGIPASTLTKIFDPFFTTKFTGRGLGLAAVLGIVRAAGGGIEVSSTVGRGSTFRVLLPASADNVVVGDPAHPPQTASPQDLPCVLVIDDEQIVLQTTRAALRKASYEVLLAASGAEGLELFQSRKREIALVLLDMSMPVMDGKEVLEKIRELDDRVPVLIFSGFSEDQVHRHFAGLQISGFLQKPFTSHKIASAVHALLPQPSAASNVERRQRTGGGAAG